MSQVFRANSSASHLSPESSLHRLMVDLLERADIRIGGSRPWDMQINALGVPERIFAQGNLGLGEAYMDGAWEVERLDDEDISGRPTYHLRAIVDEETVGPLTYYTITGSPVTVDLWIDRDTHDLLLAQLSEPPGEERPHPAVWTLELSHHGEDITIEPPPEAA